MRLIAPRTDNQRAYVEAIQNKTVIFCLGRAGVGKSYLAIYEGLKMIEEFKNKKNDSKIKRIMYCRPIIKEKRVEESVGFLPGGLDDKVSNMYNGLFHNLEDIVGTKEAGVLIENGTVKTTILSHIRGSSFNNTLMILDESTLLYTESRAIKLFLTRIGKNSKAIILGDQRQSPLDVNSMDMLDAMNRLGDIDEVACVEMDDFADIQRSEIVRKILQKYEGE